MPARAASLDLAQSLCAARSGAAAFPAAASLLRAAAESEARLEQLREAPETDPARILVAPQAAVGEADDGAIAAYCAAAGETMRLASAGSQVQAFAYLLTAFREAQEAGNSALAALSAYRLGLVGISEPGVAGVRGASPAARPDGSPAAKTATGDSSCARLARSEPGNALRTMAERAFECAAASASFAGQARLAALARLRLAKLYLDAAGEPDRDGEALRGSARETAIAALAPAQSVADPAERAELLARLATLVIALGGSDDPAVANAVRGLREAARETGDASGLAEAVVARQALAHGNAAAARAALQAAILAESRRSLPSRLPGLYLLLARAEPSAALADVEAAYAALDGLRPLLPRVDPLTDESTFSLLMRDVFAAAAEAQLDAAVGAAAPLRIRRAQQVVEAYRQAELQSAFGSGCVPPREPLRPADLRPGEIVLYPLLLPDRVELLYVSRNGDQGEEPQFRRLPPNRAENRQSVSRLVEQVVLALSRGEQGDSWRTAARRLYDLLVGPVAGQLGPGATLAIVPDGPLRALPFAALPAPDGRYLVEQTRLSLIPALDYSEPEGERSGGKLRVVAASLERAMMLPAGNFPALAGTAREAETAVRYASAGRALPDFTRADLVQALAGRSVDVLHLATHAAFNGRSDRAFIVANGGVIRLAELRDIVGRSETRGEPLDLIVLSACETAIGDDEVSMGLSGAVVEAGARSVIGSLWEVSDLGTTRLMDEFYRRYSAGEGRSAALRDAQLALIRSGGDEASPTVWAAFTLLGAWR